jgi:hypothetical protein
MKSSSPFCTCTDYGCENNPVNHGDGCNPCIESSVDDREIPRCFFIKAGDDVDVREDWSFEAFAAVVLKE